MADAVVQDDSATTAVRLECWLGAVPAVFRLAPDEVCGIRPPRPFHLALPRQSMLPFVCEAVRAHFAPFGPPLGGELWFEHSGTPLRWQLPIGVLFDLLVGEEGDASAALPWAITVHFASFPSHTLLKATRAEAEAVLLNALKESCYLRCGSALPAMSLSPATSSTTSRHAPFRCESSLRPRHGDSSRLRRARPTVRRRRSEAYSSSCCPHTLTQLLSAA